MNFTRARSSVTIAMSILITLVTLISLLPRSPAQSSDPWIQFCNANVTLATILSGATAKTANDVLDIHLLNTVYKYDLKQHNNRTPVLMSSLDITNMIGARQLSDVMESKNGAYYFFNTMMCFEDNTGFNCNSYTDVNRTSFAGIGGISGVLSATRISNDEYLVNALATNNDIVQHILNENFTIITSTLLNVQNQVPDAMAHLSTALKRTGHDVILAFFGPFGAEYSFDHNQRNALLLDPNINHILIHDWLSCPTELCFEADFDAALYSESTFHLFRGRYHYRLEQFSRNTIDIEVRPNWPTILNSEYHFEAAFAIGNRNFYFKDNIIRNELAVDLYDGPTANNRLKIPIERQLRDYVPVIVEAAFTTDDSIHLIGEGFDHIYRRSTFVFDKTVVNTVAWPGLPLNIDAAVQNDGQVYFMKGNYYFIGNAYGATDQMSPRLIQNNLYQCADRNYSHSAYQLYLGISTFNDYRDYRRRCCPPDDNLAGDAIAKETNRTSHGGLSLALPIVILVIVVIGLIASLMYLRKVTRKHRDNDSRSEPDIGDILTVTDNDLSCNSEQASHVTTDVVDQFSKLK